MSYINSNIHLDKNVFRSYLSEEKFKTDLDKSLTVKNPEWISKARFSRWQGFRKTTNEYLYFYRQNTKEFILPRNYNLDSLIEKGLKIEDKRIPGWETNYRFNTTPRDYQKEYLKDYPQILTSDDKILNCPCGSGKTFLGIYLAHYYSVITLILVPTHFLARQWDEKIKAYTTASTHIFSSTDTEIPLGKDFYIVSFDLFTLRELSDKFVESIGHVIMDESHRMGANTYLPILNMLPAKRRTSLTATFRRSDGMHRILAFHFGEVYKMNHEVPKPTVYPVILDNVVRSVLPKKGKWELLKTYLEEEFDEVVNETKDCIEFDLKLVHKTALAKKGYSLTKTNALRNILNRAHKQSYAILDNYLSSDKNRRRKVVAIIESCMQNDRTVLFLSKRKTSLKRYHKVFSEYKPLLIVSKSTDNMNQEEKDYMNKKCKLIFGIRQLANEGLDVERIDTIIYEHPIKDTEQSVGRATRVLPNKKPSVVLYLLDENSMCVGIYNAARKYIPINATTGEEINWKNVNQVL